jgi:hypothetical protein
MRRGKRFDGAWGRSLGHDRPLTLALALALALAVALAVAVAVAVALSRKGAGTKPLRRYSTETPSDRTFKVPINF